ncbi:hypothetical protein CCACVL1_02361, partial [Corchorus capsularis]
MTKTNNINRGSAGGGGAGAR